MTTTASPEPTPDADGYMPATIALACPYDGGELVPMMEYEGPAYVQERIVTGTECDRCMAEWNKDGSPRRGPHAATVAYEKRVAEEAARLAADPSALTKLAQGEA